VAGEDVRRDAEPCARRTGRTLDADGVVLVVQRPVAVAGRARAVQLDGLERRLHRVRAGLDGAVDLYARPREFVAVVGLCHELPDEFSQVVVELPGVAHPDGLAEVREREYVALGVPQRPEDGDSRVVRQRREHLLGVGFPDELGFAHTPGVSALRLRSVAGFRIRRAAAAPC
jgi:hypothetical protein